MRRSLFGSLDVAGWRAEVADKIVKEVGDRLRFLVDVGLDYLTLDRSAESLSGGEAQRIRLASQVGSGLTGVMYILDEPSIGLHQRDNQRLLGTLKHLRDLGNTVLVVEHDEEAIRAADDVLDIGPGAGVHGGGSSRRYSTEVGIADISGVTRDRHDVSVWGHHHRRDGVVGGVAQPGRRDVTTVGQPLRSLHIVRTRREVMSGRSRRGERPRPG